MHLRTHEPLARIAAGSGISVGTAHACTCAGIDLLAARAPGLLRALCEADPGFVLRGAGGGRVPCRSARPRRPRLDGALAECDRLGKGRADFSAKHRLHGVNGQVVTDPRGEVLWLSPAVPGRCHDLTAVRTRRIIRIRERQGVPILARPRPTSVAARG